MQVRRVAVRGVIFKDGEMLCQQLKPGSDNSKRDYWCTPGGGLEIGESIKNGLYREMIEETGIAPKIGRLLFVQQFSEDGVKEQMEFFFHIENAEDYAVIDLSATSHGELEIEHVEFVDPTKHNVLPAFLQTVDIQSHIDSNAPVEVYYETR